jgi:hypothetical protein
MPKPKTYQEYLDQGHKHKAEVIEIYDDGLRAAVKFYCNTKKGERIECVNRDYNLQGETNFFIGQKGTVDYVRSLNGYRWVFVPVNLQGVAL